MFHLGIIFLAAYLVGSINFGLILGYIQGLDLRSQGSGNAGATNALRILGARSGIFVFVGDAFKGYFSLYLCNLVLAQQENLLFLPSDYLFLSLILSLIGHCYPIWFNFRGGKGAATALGVHHNFHTFSLIIFLFIVYTHRSNIQSMYKGKEEKL